MKRNRPPYIDFETGGHDQFVFLTRMDLPLAEFMSN